MIREQKRLTEFVEKLSDDDQKVFCESVVNLSKILLPIGPEFHMIEIIDLIKVFKKIKYENNLQSK